MLLTVFCLRLDRSELTFSLQVDADFELQNFRALCELESGIPAAESQIVYAERPLTDNHRSLASYGLKDGDVVILQQVENAEMRPPAQLPGLPRIDFSSIAVPGISSAPLTQPPPQPPAPPRPRPSPPELPSSPQGLDNPALLRDMLLANPHELSLLKERNPPLAEALLSGDLEKFTRVLVEQQQDRARREQERIRLFSADPFDLEAQAKIEEDIRQQNIEENMTIAMEEAPESFGQVVMLYINCKVNGHPVKAFVDSGAQMTIMSQACAERCNIMRLVDRRWAGIAKGVGTQKIIGRVHLAQVQIEGDFLPCSFSILEEQPMDMLLGLDMLKRHQCSIDLKKNVLVIGTTGSQTTFLPEGELPECARLAYGAGREDVRPEEIADHELAEALQKSVEEAENSEKETTSLETPSLPTSDGFKRPVRYQEIGPKANNPRSRILDRSISAPSVCSRRSSQAETVNHRAVKSEDSLPECSVTLKSGDLPLPVCSDPIASANVHPAPAGKNGMESSHSPSIPSQTTSGKPAACFGLQKPNVEEELLSLEPLVEGRSSSSNKQMKEVVGPFLLEHAERDPVHELHLDLKTCEKPGNELFQKEQNAPNAEEHLCPKAANAEPSLSGAISEGRGSMEEGERGLSSQEERRPEHAASTCCGSETSMEADAAEGFLVAAGDPSDKPNASSTYTNSRCSIMEVELSKRDSPLPPVSDLMPPGSIGFESAAVSLSAAASASGGQLSDQVEDPCISLTSALKELHQLLIVNSKQDFAISPHEVSPPLAAVPEVQAADREVSPEERECTHLDNQDAGLSFPEHVGVEALAGTQTFTAGMESIDMREMHQSAESCEQKAQIVQESSAFLSSSTTLEQLWSGECCTSSSQCVFSDQVLGTGISEESQHLPYSLSDVQDAPQSTQTSLPEETEAPNIPCTALQSPPDAPAELLSSPPVASPSPAAPRLPIFPAADIDQIVGAGFTPQEAGEALEHAGGNADLAILILLAKNIVVPT